MHRRINREDGLQRDPVRATPRGGEGDSARIGQPLSAPRGSDQVDGLTTIRFSRRVEHGMKTFSASLPEDLSFRISSTTELRRKQAPTSTLVSGLHRASQSEEKAGLVLASFLDHFRLTPSTRLASEHSAFFGQLPDGIDEEAVATNKLAETKAGRSMELALNALGIEVERFELWPVGMAAVSDVEGKNSIYHLEAKIREGSATSSSPPRRPPLWTPRVKTETVNLADYAARADELRRA